MDFRVNVGDLATAAQLTYPAGRCGPFPTVILIPGSGPYDMNFTIVDPATHQLRSQIFDMSTSLTLHRYATVRYSTHYVTQIGIAKEVQEYYSKFTVQRLLADATKFYEATRTSPQVDPSHIYLLSPRMERGTSIAAQVNVVLATGKRDHPPIVHPNRGHSPAPAPTTFADNSTPIAQQPLRDVVAWLDRHTGQAPSSATPGVGTPTASGA